VAIVPHYPGDEAAMLHRFLHDPAAAGERGGCLFGLGLGRASRVGLGAAPTEEAWGRCWMGVNGSGKEGVDGVERGGGGHGSQPG
jgi:hypothetical protein